MASRAAIHEAGHAVAARTLGAQVIRVEANGLRRMCTWARNPGDDGTLRGVRTPLLVTLAGEIAVQISRGGSWRDLDLADWLAREESASRLRWAGIAATCLDALTAIMDGHREPARQWLDLHLPLAGAKADEILRRHWEMVEATADRLDRDGEYVPPSGRVLDPSPRPSRIGF